MHRIIAFAFHFLLLQPRTSGQLGNLGGGMRALQHAIHGAPMSRREEIDE